MFKKKKSSTSSYITGSIIGAAIGVAGYYLLATEKGQDFKAELAKRIPEKKGNHGSLSHMLLEFGSEWNEDLKEILGQSKNPEHKAMAKEQQFKSSSTAPDQTEIGQLIQGVLDEE